MFTTLPPLKASTNRSSLPRILLNVETFLSVDSVELLAPRGRSDASSPVPSARSLESAWRWRGGPRREGRETRSHGARLRAPGGLVSRAAAEAQSGSGRGGEAAAPTSGVEGLNQAPRNRSAVEVSRSRRRWAYDGVSPTGARRDRPSGRPDEAEGGKRRHWSGAGAITQKVEGASFGRR